MPALCIIPARALEDERLTPSDLRALLAIGKHTSTRGGNVFAKRDTLAEVARLDPANYRRSVRKLVELGYVRRVSRFKPDGSPWTNLISIVLDEPVPSDAVLVAATEGAESTPSPSDEGEDDGGEGAKVTPTPSGRESPPPQGAEFAPREGAESTPKTSKPQNDATAARAAVSDEARLRIRLTAVVNAAFDAMLGPNRDPIPSGTAANLVEAVAAHAIDPAWAEGVLDGAARGYAKLKGKAPRTMQYFTPGLVEAWGRESARREAASVGPIAAGVSVPAAAVRVGAQLLTPEAIWQACVDVGLTSPMLSADTVRESIARLVARGVVQDGEAFARLVAVVNPAQLAEISFRKARDERLRERLADFARRAA